MNFEFNDIVSALTHIRGGLPARRLSTRSRLAEHRSVFFGPSYDFYDIQEYDPERDPPNQIIASLISEDEDIIFARKCVEPHEIRVIFLADLSSSLDSGTALTKRKLFLEAIGYIGVTAARYQDPIGLLGFADKVVLNQPARGGINNFMHLLRVTYDFLKECDADPKKPARRTDFGAAFDSVRRTLNRPCFVPVISDFIGFEKIIDSSTFKQIVARHELIFVFLDDPEEYALPRPWGYIRTRDMEDGQEIIISGRKLKAMEIEIRRKRKELRKKLNSMGVDSVVLEDGKQYNRLYRFFAARHKYMRRGR
jgi:uncharacterized protein (DUF58 family)